MRLIGVPRKRARNAASSRTRSSASGGLSLPVFTASAVSRAAWANLFHGQTARQSSQPKMRFPIGGAVARRDMTLMLDGEVGDAGPRIEPVRRGEGFRRAHIETAPAGSAMIVFGRVRLDRGTGEDLAEKEPRAEVARDEIGVLALPAEPCARGERLLHHRRGIDEELHIVSRQRLNPCSKLLELCLEHVVIVGALRIGRDRATRSLIQDRERVAAARIVQPEQDDGARLRPESPRALAPLARLGEPGHVPLAALGEERGERGTRPLDRIGRGEADRVEAKRLGFFGDRGFEALCHRFSNTSFPRKRESSNHRPELAMSAEITGLPGQAGQ